MSSPFSKRSLYLKRKNEELIEKLESNSVILQNRLKKLRSTTRTQLSPDTSSDIPGLNAVKRKHGYDSWLMRNSSGQVSAALNPLYFQNSSSNIISYLDKVNTMPLCVNEATMTSPAKRSKTLHNSSHERQDKESIDPRRSWSCRKKPKVRSRKACPDCYCQTTKRQSVLKKQNEKVGRVCVGCSHNKSFNSSFDSSDDYSKLNTQRKTLEEARTLINYSPESVFLRRLKKRSQTNLNKPGTSDTETDQSSVADAGRQINISARKDFRPSRKIIIGKSVATTEKCNSSVKDTMSESRSKAKQQLDKCRTTSSKEKRSASKHYRDKPENALENETIPPHHELGSCSEKSKPRIKRTVHSVSVANRKVNQSPIKNIRKTTSSRQTQTQETIAAPHAVDKNKSPAKLSKQFKPPFITSVRSEFRSSKQNKSIIQPASLIHHCKSGRTDTSFNKEKTRKENLKPFSQNISENQALLSKKTVRPVRTVSSKSTSSSPSKKDIQPSSKTRAHSREQEYLVELKEKPESPVVKSKQRKCKVHAKEFIQKATHDSSVRHSSIFCGKENARPSLSTSVCSPSRWHRSKIYRKYCKKHRRKDGIESVSDKMPHCYHKTKSTGMSREPTPYEMCHRKSPRDDEVFIRSCCNKCCCCSEKGDSFHVQPPQLVGSEPCDHGSQSHCQWVDELSKYRQSHWFDCHAYQASRERSTTCMAGKETLHSHHNGCQHILNDRLFPVPLSSYRPCVNCCKQCCGQRNDKVNFSEIFPREITLNTTRHQDEAPPPKPKPDDNKAEPFKIFNDPEKKPRNRKLTGCMLQHPIYSKPLRPKLPAPANSLALRYQKGVV